ncbi:cell division protein ZapA [Polaromonas sp.]|uniref:cell division protein ZapA n=1 Tax=Polaromonas sp. TaxID=1869339 RepID=UPI0017DAB093|nr:cell division protein ZapA [Polaromonas sp.]NML84258.1 cell division protein ZapA [Polaromonas sp.]
MKQLQVQIMGQNYLLGCPENGDERLLQAVGMVDEAMCKIRDAGKVKARDRIAVLAALNLAFELAERAPAATVPPQQSLPMDQARDGAPEAPQLSALLQRLDVVLGIDGRLL